MTRKVSLLYECFKQISYRAKGETFRTSQQGSWVYKGEAINFKSSVKDRLPQYRNYIHFTSSHLFQVTQRCQPSSKFGATWVGVPLHQHPQPPTGLEGATRHTPRPLLGEAQQAIEGHHGSVVTTTPLPLGRMGPDPPPPNLGEMAPRPRLREEAKMSYQFGGGSGKASKLRQEPK